MVSQSLYLLPAIKEFLRPYDRNILVQAVGESYVSKIDVRTHCLWCGLTRIVQRDVETCDCQEQNVMEDAELVDEIERSLNIVRIAENDEVLHEVINGSEFVHILKMAVRGKMVIKPLWYTYIEDWRNVHLELCHLEKNCAFLARCGEAFGKFFLDRFIAHVFEYTRRSINKLTDVERAYACEDRKAKRIRKTKVLVKMFRETDRIRLCASCLSVLHFDLIKKWLEESTDFLQLWVMSEELKKLLYAAHCCINHVRFNSYSQYLLEQVNTEWLGNLFRGFDDQNERENCQILWDVFNRMIGVRDSNLSMQDVFTAAMEPYQSCKIWKSTNEPGTKTSNRTVQPASGPELKEDLYRETDLLLAQLSSLIG